MSFSYIGALGFDQNVDGGLIILRPKFSDFFSIVSLLLAISAVMATWIYYNSSYFEMDSVDGNPTSRNQEPNSQYSSLLYTDEDLTTLAPEDTYTNWETNDDWYSNKAVLNYPAGKSVLNYGATADDGTDDTSAFQAAINNATQGTAVIVPPGKYRISDTLRLKGGVSLRGSGSDNTHLEFRLTSTKNALEVNNRASYSWVDIVADANVGDNQIKVVNSDGFSVGDYIEIEEDNHKSFFTTGRNGNPAWAQRAIVQLTKVESISGNMLILSDPLHHRILRDANAKVSKVNLVTGTGIEDLHLDLSNNTSWRGFNIVYWGVANSWIIGVKADYSARAHVLLTNSYSNLIYGNYFNDSHLHGGNLEGYGVYSVKSSKNTIENNIFKHLRHALIIAMGASGNIYGYNYSVETHAYWNNANPTGSLINTGDISVHGFYPTLNLYEGNVAQVAAIDNGWGSNGPTTLLRNCLEKPRANQAALKIDADNYRHNIFGNILGISKIGGTSVGIHTSVKNSTNLHGNHDVLTGDTEWKPNLPQGNIPYTLYLDTIPPFLEDSTLPLLGPEYVDRCTNPAKERFENGTIYTDSSIRTGISAQPSNTVTPTPVSTLTQTVTPLPTNVNQEHLSNIYQNAEVLYLFSEKSGNIVEDRSGKSPALDLTIQDPSAVTWGNNSLTVKSPTILNTLDSATRLVEACRTTEELSLELWIKPNTEHQHGPARILTLSQDAFSSNFTVGHGLSSGTATDLFDFRLRTNATDYIGRPSLSSSGGVTSNKLTHLVYTRGINGTKNVYIDGRLDSSQQSTDSVATWNSGYKIALANEFETRRPWLGEYHLVAIYCQELAAAEVAAHHSTGHDFISEIPSNAPISATTIPEPVATSTPIPTSTPSVPPTATPETGYMSGTLFVDSNGNGVRDSNEDPLSDVVVLLIDFGTQNQITTMTTSTDQNGVYEFRNVPPSDYIISFALPPGYNSNANTRQLEVDDFDNSIVLQAIPVVENSSKLFLPLID